MRAVMYGAGNIGRGFIGQLFAASRYEVTFIDVADNVIDAIKRNGRYPVRILSEDAFEDRWTDGVKAINGNNKEEAALAIAECNIMATAVGVRALPFIAPVIAAGIKKRLEAGGGALNIIICENLINANKILEGLIKDHLSEEEKRFFDEQVGLVEASIGRMAPIQKAEMQDGNPLRVCVEAYGFLPVDKDAFKGEIPQIAGMYPFNNFDFYIQRKLFVHNMGHATCAYFGMVKGDEYIYQTVRRSSILFIAQNAMLESALALSAEFNKPLPDLHFHIRDLLNRFSNKALGDTCARVGCDTARKLGPEDRLVGAIKCCTRQGITPAFISAGAGAALYAHLKEKQHSQNREVAETLLSTISGLARESEEAKRIILFYAMICEGADFKDIIALASKIGNKQII